MDHFMISAIVLLAAIFGARAINDKAVQQLNQAEKAALVDLFYKTRYINFITIISIVILFFVSVEFRLLDLFLVNILYFTVYLIFMIYTSYTKLKSNNFPKSYINAYILSSTIRTIGLAIFLAFSSF